MAIRKKPEPPRPIIVKKITMVAAGHHGGAWKVAYADFVTAMMAFFLLLWILGATTEKQRRGIADYFTPTLVKTKQGSAGSGQGVLGGASLTQVDNYPFKAGQTGTKTLTIPRDATGGPKEGGSKIKRSSRAKEALQKKLASTERLRRLARQVRMVDTTQGVRIDMVDDANFSMFRLGTTILTPQAVELLSAISQAIGTEAGGGGGPLTIRGHTDALPYKQGIPGNNWSLSAGRAEATRQQLIRDGVEPARFRRIEGVADTELLIPADPHDPRNRRISITLAD
ncbi:flagellar motor protein MotB [Novosphingobium aerophilum]|uniref:flagellar motor protein MotB n=1 Tax=Novosphingobium TaxID=165696 RepID=UPI0006C869D7|nr:MULTISPECIES: flagellar motor protein MotB [unclassified Novosphingobium]KPH65779.1 flagellar motor protein [Novosphingobium sp. ST904]MPS70331.1 flagellar motor protein [Novosphingobium sp.]TCM37363.1 chemotaxis protein MotB [Novosphingobium sp. ST904]WRT93678.1 flagellar motor protein MotB [Novosphingobium sp. RL4]